MSSTEPRTPDPRDPGTEPRTDVGTTDATTTGAADLPATGDTAATEDDAVGAAGTGAGADTGTATGTATGAGSSAGSARESRSERTVLSVDDDEDDDLDELEDTDEDDDDTDDDAFLAGLDDERELAGASLGARLGVEALGTFALVLVITGVALYGPISGADAVGVALAAGLVLVGVTSAFGHLSGGHFNPAVTLGTAIAGLTRWVDVPLYWLAQLLGGVAAGATVFLTIPESLPAALQVPDVPTFFASTANSWGEFSRLWLASGEQTSFDQRTAFVVELVAAAVLTAVVLGTARRRWSFAPAPVAVGLTYAALFLLTSPITGGSANPARSTAAAVFSGGDAVGQLWLFWVAPLLGAALVGLGHFGFGRGGSPRAGETIDDDVAVPRS
ncbi:aquaporin [Actinotalea ferrariae]|uniref:MIP/aquaporin family protein n=1 Tax=Actinotalea ferrariae TaxID=1386098 RepID=UPI001C8C46C4|nr:aquaporin [Actinotalea ferrariae]MBX9243932.1 aquaporin [Actinotalea ferrariae]